MMNILEYSAIHIGDLHGRIDALESAIETFEKEKVDKLVFMGDYVDSYDVTDTEILYVLDQVIRYKRENPNKVICLLGNHDISYIENDPWYRASGYRPQLQHDIQHRFMEATGLFQVAWRNGTYMCSHAGILSAWVEKYYDRLSYYSDKFGIDMVDSFDILLNAIYETHDRWMLFTVPVIRGGHHGSIGGPIWADVSEIESEPSCSFKYTHIVGHNSTKMIRDHVSKAGTKTIFTDCLSSKTEFLILKK